MVKGYEIDGFRRVLSEGAGVGIRGRVLPQSGL
jgi:hypothetical protein